MNIDQLRAQLVNFEVYLEASRMLGLATVDLPEFKFITAELAGAGITGKIDMPTIGNSESLELVLNWVSVNEHIFELLPSRAVDLALYGAQQIYDHANGTNGVEQIKILVRGLPKTGTLGKFEPSATTDSKTTLEVIYMRILIDGKEYLEFDKVNYIFKVEGTDYLKKTRQVLGLTDDTTLDISYAGWD